MMLKKITALVLLLLLAASFLPAQAESPENYFLLGESGMEMMVLPDLKEKLLDGEMEGSGYVCYFEDDEGVRAAYAVFFQETGFTLDAYYDGLVGSNMVLDAKKTSVNGVPCIIYQLDNVDFVILSVAFLSENGDLLEISFQPYGDEFAAQADQMVQSIRKAE